jgi:hypothetical protein
MKQPMKGAGMCQEETVQVQVEDAIWKDSKACGKDDH